MYVSNFIYTIWYYAKYMEPILVLPSEKYKESFLEAIAEQPDEQLARVEGYDINRYTGDFDLFLKNIANEREGKNLPDSWVPQTVYWLVEDDKFIGRFSIRHTLNDHLRKMGGHIGYSIRPTERNKGYGKLGLKLALPKAKELGIDPALITCNPDNIASRKVIEANGGIFHDEVVGDDGTAKLRFWVPTS